HSLKIIPRHVYETSWPSKFIKRIDLRKGLPLPDETADFVYSSHFLEHITYPHASKLIKECHRVLKHGGWLRIACPDLRLIANKYVEGDFSYVLFNVSHKADLSQAFINSLG